MAGAGVIRIQGAEAQTGNIFTLGGVGFCIVYLVGKFRPVQY